MSGNHSREFLDVIASVLRSPRGYRLASRLWTYALLCINTSKVSRRIYRTRLQPALAELQKSAGRDLPLDGAEVLTVLPAKTQDELVRLLAICEPTAESYFQHITKAFDHGSGGKVRI